MNTFWIINCILNFILAAFCAGIVIPQILLIAARRKLYDEIDERKIHKGAVPRLGGMAFKPVILFSTALLLGLNLSAGHVEVLQPFCQEIDVLLSGFCSIIVLYLVGIADDLIGVKYSAKFVAQIFCAVMFIAGGLYVADFHGVVWANEIPLWIAYPFTVLLIVFIINAINLIDGIDGLCSGLCSVAFVFYGISFLVLKEYAFAMLAFATLGVLVPFFYYNVFGDVTRGKKIFMGDTGSLTIGIIICFMSLRLLLCAKEAGEGVPNPVVLAFSPLMVPCFDVVRVYLHRIKNGKNPFLPDKNHIHHKLLALGIRQRPAMVGLLIFSTVLSGCNILLSRYVEVNILIIANLVIWTILNMWMTKKILAKGNNA